MKIRKLRINSFRGLKNVELDLNDHLNVFQGKNELGKTSIIDSVLWVLTGETLVYGKQDSDNRNKHNLRDVINVVLEMDNGLILERKYYDVWKEDKDGNERFSRTENQFFINGAKYKVAEYFEFIRNSLGLVNELKTKDINLLRALVDYNYLSSIDYKITRKFYEELMNLKSDMELLSEPQYQCIATDMQVLRFDIGKCKNKYADGIKQCEKEIETISSIIKTKEASFNKEVADKYDSLVEERMNLLKSNIYEQSEYERLNKTLDEINVNIHTEQKNVLEALNHANEQRSEYIKKGNELQNEIKELNRQISNNIEKMELRREQGINHYERLIEQERNAKFNAINCPHCGKAINESEKNLYEREKKELISTYQSEIEKAKTIIANLNDSNKIANETLSKVEEQFKTVEDKYHANEIHIQKLNEEKENNSKVKELLLEKQKVSNELDVFINNYNNTKLEEISKLDEKIAESSSMNRVVNDLEIYRNSLKDLKRSKALLEEQKDLVQEFKEHKLRMIKDNTCKLFPAIELEILEVNDNTGTIKEVCYAKFRDVEYSGMNDGNKKLLGVTIIENIRKALNLQDFPIVFDKFGDVDTINLNKILKTTTCQILSTVVTDDEKFSLKGE